MGKTIHQLRDSIKEKVSKFVVSDDNRFDNSWIEDEIVSKNCSLLREEIKVNRELHDRYYITYDNIAITREEVSSSSVAGITVSSDDYVYKSNLPSLLDGISWRNIKYLGGTDINSNSAYTRKSLNGYMALEGNKWTKDNTIYTMIGNTAFYKSLPTEGTRLAYGMLLLSDQRDDSNWDDETSEFITPSTNKLELLVVKEILSIVNVSPDVLNDATFFNTTKTT